VKALSLSVLACVLSTVAYGSALAPVCAAGTSAVRPSDGSTAVERVAVALDRLAQRTARLDAVWLVTLLPSDPAGAVGREPIRERVEVSRHDDALWLRVSPADDRSGVVHELLRCERGSVVARQVAGAQRSITLGEDLQWPPAAARLPAILQFDERIALFGVDRWSDVLTRGRDVEIEERGTRFEVAFSSPDGTSGGWRHRLAIETEPQPHLTSIEYRAVSPIGDESWAILGVTLTMDAFVDFDGMYLPTRASAVVELLVDGAPQFQTQEYELEEALRALDSPCLAFPLASWFEEGTTVIDARIDAVGRIGRPTLLIGGMHHALARDLHADDVIGLGGGRTLVDFCESADEVADPAPGALEATVPDASVRRGRGAPSASTLALAVTATALLAWVLASGVVVGRHARSAQAAPAGAAHPARMRRVVRPLAMSVALAGAVAFALCVRAEREARAVVAHGTQVVEIHGRHGGVIDLGETIVDDRRGLGVAEARFLVRGLEDRAVDATVAAVSCHCLELHLDATQVGAGETLGVVARMSVRTTGRHSASATLTFDDGTHATYHFVAHGRPGTAVRVPAVVRLDGDDRGGTFDLLIPGKRGRPPEIALEISGSLDARVRSWRFLPDEDDVRRGHWHGAVAVSRRDGPEGMGDRVGSIGVRHDGVLAAHTAVRR